MSPITLLRTALTAQVLLGLGRFLDPYDGMALPDRVWLPHPVLSRGTALDVVGMPGPARSCDVHPRHPRLQLMRNLRPYTMSTTRFTGWTVRASSLPVSWADAFARLAAQT